MSAAQLPPPPHHQEEEEEDFEWEEWDGKGKFWHHCVAGSMAGVAEHTLLYPVDTVKTHIQACASCPHSPSAGVGTMKSTHMYSNNTLRSGNTGATKPKPSATAPTSTAGSHRTLPPNSSMISTMRHIVTAHPSSSSPSSSSTSSSLELAARTAAESAPRTTSTTNYIRLWRGVQTMILGCIPAHAFYFSSYEMTKAYFATVDPHTHQPHLSTTGGMAAGAAATFGHDCVMAPLDTIKQRLQLGHYSGMYHAAQHMWQFEGLGALYRSFPITLLTNVPYGMIMVSTNEYLKEYLLSQQEASSAHLHSSSHSHSPVLPLWTCLQASSMAGMVAAAMTTPLDRIKTSLQTQKLQPTCEIGTCPQICPKLLHKPLDIPGVLKEISAKEGLAGFYRGWVPRIVTHTPAVAISWTTYETAKQYLQTNY